MQLFKNKNFWKIENYWHDHSTCNLGEAERHIKIELNNDRGRNWKIFLK